MDMEKFRVQDLMQKDVKMVSKGTTIFDAAKKDWKIRSLPTD